MGATGAGVATLISRIAMPLVAIWYFYRRKRLREYAALLPEVRYSRRSVRQLVRMGVPISGQMFLEASAFVLTSIMMGWFDAVAISANQIALTMGNFAFMIVTAVGAATTIRISHCYGARRFDELGLAARAALHIVIAWNLFAAVVFVTLRQTIPYIFTTNAEVVSLASSMLVLIALYQLPDGIQNISVGVLRGVQDVKIIMPLALTAYWVLNLPVGYLCGFTLGLGPWGALHRLFRGADDGRRALPAAHPAGRADATAIRFGPPVARPSKPRSAAWRPRFWEGGEFPCRIDPPCIESVVPSDAVDASADEEQRDGEQRQNREDERQPRALRQRVEVKVEMLALTTGPCADAAEVFFHAFGFFRVACVRGISPPSAPIRLQK